MLRDVSRFPKTIFTTSAFAFAALALPAPLAFSSNTATTGAAASKKATVADNGLLERMRSRYSDVKTLTAEFSQTQKNPALGADRVSSGRIYIARPNMFRWETLEPEKSILVGNGHRVWYYTPPFREGEKGQVIVRAATDVQSRLAIDLLSGAGDPRKSFRITPLEPGRYRLKPLKSAGDIEQIELFIEKSTNLVYKVTLFTSTGNQTELRLKNVALGPKLGLGMFSFVAPESTEEIR